MDFFYIFSYFLIVIFLLRSIFYFKTFYELIIIRTIKKFYRVSDKIRIKLTRFKFTRIELFLNKLPKSSFFLYIENFIYYNF